MKKEFALVNIVVLLVKVESFNSFVFLECYPYCCFLFEYTTSEKFLFGQ